MGWPIYQVQPGSCSACACFIWRNVITVPAICLTHNRSLVQGKQVTKEVGDNILGNKFIHLFVNICLFWSLLIFLTIKQICKRVKSMLISPPPSWVPTQASFDCGQCEVINAFCITPPWKFNIFGDLWEVSVQIYYIY